VRAPDLYALPLLLHLAFQAVPPSPADFRKIVRSGRPRPKRRGAPPKVNILRCYANSKDPKRLLKEKRDNRMIAPSPFDTRFIRYRS
jgi:hypothetical protein